MPLPPSMSPEQLEKLQVFGDFLAEVVLNNWKKRGVFTGLSDLILQKLVNSPNNMPGVAQSLMPGLRAPSSPPPGAPSGYERVHRVVLKNEEGELYEIDRTVPQLLAEIVNNLRDLNTKFENLQEEEREQTKRRRKKGDAYE